MIMKITELMMGFLLLATIVLSICSTAAFSATNVKQTRLLLPWMAITAGGAYFLIGLWYFNQPELLDGVPIRMDLPMIAPFWLYSLYVGFSSMKKFEPKEPENQEKFR